jgi:hypothetical protein
MLKTGSSRDTVTGVEHETTPLSRALARRDRHRQRSLIVRGVTVVAGGLVCGVAVILFFAPEVALPLLVAGLGLLALEFDWAARGLAWALTRSARITGWFRRMSRPMQIAIVVAVIVGVGSLALTF